METIQYTNLKEEVTNLKIGQRIFIPISEDLSSTMRLMELQCKSYENLFTSYITDNSEKTLSFKLDDFLDRYSEVYSKMEIIKANALKEYLGDAYPVLYKGPYMYNFDFELNVLMIIRLRGASYA